MTEVQFTPSRRPISVHFFLISFLFIIYFLFGYNCLPVNAKGQEDIQRSTTGTVSIGTITVRDMKPDEKKMIGHLIPYGVRVIASKTKGINEGDTLFNLDGRDIHSIPELNNVLIDIPTFSTVIAKIAKISTKGRAKRIDFEKKLTIGGTEAEYLGSKFLHSKSKWGPVMAMLQPQGMNPIFAKSNYTETKHSHYVSSISFYDLLPMNRSFEIRERCKIIFPKRKTNSGNSLWEIHPDRVYYAGKHKLLFMKSLIKFTNNDCLSKQTSYRIAYLEKGDSTGEYPLFDKNNSSGLFNEEGQIVYNNMDRSNTIMQKHSKLFKRGVFFIDELDGKKKNLRINRKNSQEMILKEVKGKNVLNIPIPKVEYRTKKYRADQNIFCDIDKNGEFELVRMYYLPNKKISFAFYKTGIRYKKIYEPYSGLYK